MVVLDWRLKDDDREYALKLLKGIVASGSDRNALRLVAFYTGEAGLPAIQEAIMRTLVDVGLRPEVVDACTVAYRHGRVVLYAKPNVNLAVDLQDRKVTEDELPDRLIDDFSNMTAGLLPSIALLSLAAVRESAHMVLDRFCTRLDPAFLAHRASLANPDDAERQIVNHVAEELRGLMGYAVADQSPAGEDAITGWMHELAADSQSLQFGEKTLNAEQALTAAIRGLNQSVLRNSEFEHLSEGLQAHSLLGGIYRDLLEQVQAWLIDVLQSVDDPVGALQKRGLPTEGHVEVTIALTLEPPRQVDDLARWAQQQATWRGSSNRPYDDGLEHQVTDRGRGNWLTWVLIAFGVGWLVGDDGDE